MAHTAEMLASTPHTSPMEVEKLAEAIDVLLECASTCNQCADACLSEPEVATLTRCIRLDLDCADICATTGRVVARSSDQGEEVLRALLVACAAACRACADECAGHAPHMEHCRICADQCRHCEQVCLDLVDALP
jgi:hypothetical protein